MNSVHSPYPSAWLKVYQHYAAINDYLAEHICLRLLYQK